MSWNAQLWYWFGTDGLNALLLLVSAASAIAVVALLAITTGRGDARMPDRLARERKLLLGIVAVLVAATVGVALDKGFADNIPPYDEPVVAQIGAAAFGLCTLGSIVLAVIAVARAARSRSAPTS